MCGCIECAGCGWFVQENILRRIHRHLAPDVSEDSCQQPHCLSHQNFAMSVVEQVRVVRRTSLYSNRWDEANNAAAD